MQEQETWVIEDWVTNKCNREEVGTPKPIKLVEVSPPQPTTPLSVIEEVPARRLKKDVIAAYEALGGKDYLIAMGRKDPANFNKLLAKILPQAIEADVRHELSGVDISTLPTATLKAMFLKMIAQPGQTIDAEITQQSDDSN